MTPIQIRRLVKMLETLSRRLQSGQVMPPEIFDALLGLMPLTTVETCILRRHRGRTEIWLTCRSRRESRYPGIWHVPGSFLRSGESFTTVVRRLERHELGGTARLAGVKFLTLMNVPNEPTGHYLSAAHWCRLRGTPRRGNWFAVAKLPASVVPAHRQLIRHAAAAFQRQP